MTVDDTNIGDYVLEKGTPIAAQISLLMSDEKFFKDAAKVVDNGRVVTASSSIRIATVQTGNWSST